MTESPAITPAYPVFAPKWATLFGEDEKGIFAGCLVEDVAFTFRWIPPGRFLMGSPDDENGRFKIEGPQHVVEITGGYWLGSTAVTQAQWEVVSGENPSNYPGKNRPVENVCWDTVQEYGEQLNRKVQGLEVRLPSEAEWEYVCRAGTGGAFGQGACTEPNGKDPVLENLGWYAENSENETHEVGLKSANEWGLYDMHGNVWEWCADEMRVYDQGKQLDSKGSTDGSSRAVRGGGSFSNARSCRVTFRYGRQRRYRSGDLGFRLAAVQAP